MQHGTTHQLLFDLYWDVHGCCVGTHTLYVLDYGCGRTYVIVHIYITQQTIDFLGGFELI